ncbi:hypothetical protein THASP1DRAFT_27783 [Thamnocephalis sphaerospora]|uniref:Uncharacterized protein n=1 Tax=Thamnocephalis sphaerospora TaxID=78915 RepID=A0A4P9XVY5_9FUNG|nr:hypothetical protein THASP1DRAFT_27783 [Thamnocephalis sphaerospora]|eukprot:RKP10455.1 hypothetical protein THASP1DRAFT_27783 [Thamnocephalis sphaerospora]
MGKLTLFRKKSSATLQDARETEESRSQTVPPVLPTLGLGSGSLQNDTGRAAPRGLSPGSPAMNSLRVGGAPASQDVGGQQTSLLDEIMSDLSPMSSYPTSASRLEGFGSAPLSSPLDPCSTSTPSSPSMPGRLGYSASSASAMPRRHNGDGLEQTGGLLSTGKTSYAEKRSTMLLSFEDDLAAILNVTSNLSIEERDHLNTQKTAAATPRTATTTAAAQHSRKGSKTGDKKKKSNNIYDLYARAAAAPPLSATNSYREQTGSALRTTTTTVYASSSRKPVLTKAEKRATWLKQSDSAARARAATIASGRPSFNDDDLDDSSDSEYSSSSSSSSESEESDSEHSDVASDVSGTAGGASLNRIGQIAVARGLARQAERDRVNRIQNWAGNIADADTNNLAIERMKDRHRLEMEAAGTLSHSPAAPQPANVPAGNGGVMPPVGAPVAMRRAPNAPQPMMAAGGNNGVLANAAAAHAAGVHDLSRQHAMSPMGNGGLMPATTTADSSATWAATPTMPGMHGAMPLQHMQHPMVSPAAHVAYSGQHQPAHTTVSPVQTQPSPVTHVTPASPVEASRQIPQRAVRAPDMSGRRGTMLSDSAVSMATTDQSSGRSETSTATSPDISVVEAPRKKPQQHKTLPSGRTQTQVLSSDEEDGEEDEESSSDDDSDSDDEGNRKRRGATGKVGASTPVRTTFTPVTKQRTVPLAPASKSEDDSDDEDNKPVNVARRTPKDIAAQAGVMPRAPVAYGQRYPPNHPVTMSGISAAVPAPSMMAPTSPQRQQYPMPMMMMAGPTGVPQAHPQSYPQAHPQMHPPSVPYGWPQMMPPSTSPQAQSPGAQYGAAPTLIQQQQQKMLAAQQAKMQQMNQPGSAPYGLPVSNQAAGNHVQAYAALEQQQQQAMMMLAQQQQQQQMFGNEALHSPNAYPRAGPQTLLQQQQVLLAQQQQQQVQQLSQSPFQMQKQAQRQRLGLSPSSSMQSMRGQPLISGFSQPQYQSP